MRPKAWFLPAGDSLHLFEVAFSSDRTAAAEHWRHWRQNNVLNGAEQRLHRLLPLVFRRMEKADFPAADLNVLRGVYRYNWTRNQLLARSAATIIDKLQKAGVAVLVLKGLALAYTSYRDLGARSMQDFDILVHPEQRQQAAEILEQNGWKSEHPMGDIGALHGREFKNDQGYNLDLHWYASNQCCWPGIDDGFWSRSQPFLLQGVETRTLCPGDFLLHVCLHGAKDGVDPFGWTTDACILLEEPLELSAFVAEARQRRCVPNLHFALYHLKERVKAPVPSWLLQELEVCPVSWIDRLYFWCKIRGGYSWSVFLQPALEYLRGERTGFLDFLCRRWGLQSRRQLPAHVLERLRLKRS